MAATMPPPPAAHPLKVSPASYVFNNNITSCRQSCRRGSTAGDGSGRRAPLVSGRAFLPAESARRDVPSSSHGVQRGEREDRIQRRRSYNTLCGPAGGRICGRQGRSAIFRALQGRTRDRDEPALCACMCACVCARMCVWRVRARRNGAVAVL